MQNTLYSRQMLIEPELLDKLSKNTQISNFMKICPLGAELLHADRQTRQTYTSKNSSFRVFTRQQLRNAYLQQPFNVQDRRDSPQNTVKTITNALNRHLLGC